MRAIMKSQSSVREGVIQVQQDLFVHISVKNHALNETSLIKIDIPRIPGRSENPLK